MHDILEFLDELKELQSLYHSGDLRDFDFSTKIQKYERLVDQFEAAMDQAYRESVVFYDPTQEV